MKRGALFGELLRMLSIALLLGGCDRDLDAGSDVPRGLLPVDQRNPLVVYNDAYSDNWQGEYAMVLASSGQLELVGIIAGGLDASTAAANFNGWNAMTTAARASGMTGIPDPVASNATPLVRPSDGNIDDTQPNGTPGAHLIVDTANRFSQPVRPIVVATGGPLTDVADAYLLDHTVADRVVVISALGTATTDGGGAVIGYPNGSNDPWADEIVARRFRYVQVDTTYDQTTDITPPIIAKIPSNAFAAWIKGKQPKIINEILPDQVSLLAAAFPQYATGVTIEAEPGSLSPDAGQVPLLEPSDGGRAWVVAHANAAPTIAALRQLLTAASTYHGS